MIECKIIVEEVPHAGMQVGIVPEAHGATEKELQLWSVFEAAFTLITTSLQKAASGTHIVGDSSIQKLVEERINSISKVNENRKAGELVIHHMHQGRTDCGMPGVPKDWPRNHLWESDWKFVNCEDCCISDIKAKVGEHKTRKRN